MSVKKPSEKLVQVGVDLLPPSPPKIDLRDTEAIRRELGRVYRDMRSGRIATQDGTRVAYVLDLLRKALAEKQDSADGVVAIRVLRE